MGNVVSTITISNTPKRLVVKLLGLIDTDEVGVVKVDKSTFTGLNGLEPSFFMIEQIDYDVGGLEVSLSVDATTDVVLARFGGMGPGKHDYRKFGGISTKAVGDTGDILLSTVGGATGDSYDITLHLRKHD